MSRQSTLVRKDLATVALGSIVSVWTPASGKTVRILGGSISVSAAVSILFEDNAAGAGNYVLRTPKLLADTPYELRLPVGGIALSATDHILKATSSGAANCTGVLWGVEEG
jgi:hypothetical protein